MRRAAPDEQGFTLIEAIIAIVALGILVPALVVLLRSAGLQSAKAERLTQAALLAQGKMDEVISDKKGRGYAYVDSMLTPVPSLYDDAPLPGYTRTVRASDTSYLGVSYKEVTVQVSTILIPDVVLQTWLTQY